MKDRGQIVLALGLSLGVHAAVLLGGDRLAALLSRHVRPARVAGTPSLAVDVRVTAAPEPAPAPEPLPAEERVPVLAEPDSPVPAVDLEPDQETPSVSADVPTGLTPDGAVSGLPLEAPAEEGLLPLEAIETPYPLGSRIRGEEGVFEARVVVSPEGRVSEVECIGSSGHRSLDAAAAKALRGARFAPAPGVGERRATLRVVFRLNN